MDNKLVIVIMGQNCEKFIGMCLDSVKDADAIVYCDGGSIDNTLMLIAEENDRRAIEENKIRVHTIENKWNPKDKAMNGKQRNFYLDYIKKNYPNDWCLVLDADEVLCDYGIQILKNFIQGAGEQKLVLSPQMSHFVYNLGFEDASRERHYVPNRLFKITDKLVYPEIDQHPVLQILDTEYKIGTLEGIKIWHLRECLGVFASQDKHEENVKKSNIHTTGYLDWWHKAMLFGSYPIKRTYYGEIPTPIKKRFEI